MSEWQPIKKAPRDGTEIWVGAPGRVILAYCTIQGHWKSAWSGGRLSWLPTHWQPFVTPDPPVESKSEVVG